MTYDLDLPACPKVLWTRNDKPVGATENARPENAGPENDGQNFSQLWAKLQSLENARLENDVPC